MAAISLRIKNGQWHMTYSACLINSPLARKSERTRSSCRTENRPERTGRTAQQSVEARYAPLRVFRLELNKRQKSKEIFFSVLFLSLVGIGFAFSRTLFGLWVIPGFIAVTIFMLFVFMPLAVVPVCCLRFRKKCLLRTGPVRIDALGLSLPFGGEAEDSCRSILIRWRDLVSLGPGRASDSPEQLVFRFRTSGWDRETKLLAKPWGGARIRLDLRGFPESDHNRILSALTRFAPPDRINHRLLEMTSFDCEPTYTSIWLEALGAAPRRFASGALEPGTFLHRQRYEVVKQMATGGQATTYEAIDHEARIDEGEPWHVVLKEFVIPVHAGESAVEEMFLDVEAAAKILNSVACQSVVRLVGRFVEDYRAYLVLEYVDGETLRGLVLERLSGGAACLESKSVVELGIQMGQILARLHEGAKPVIHRDFTPDNLILTPSGTLKLIDFDVAVSEDRCGTAAVVGKPSYLAPEQFRGQATAQSDLYSLGATMFFLLAGKDPTPISTSHAGKSNPSVDETLDSIVARATEPDVSARYQSARELLKVLQALKECIK
jgi:hypothetical protein